MANRDWLNKLDLGRLSLRERLMMLFTASAILLFLVIYLYLPTHRKIPDLTQQLAAINQEVGGLEREMAEVRNDAEQLRASNQVQEKASLGELEGSMELMDRINKLGPERQKLAHILEELNRLAKSMTVDFSQVRPEQVQNQGPLKVQPISIEARSTMRGMAKFLNMVEQLPRLVAVQKIQIDADPSEAAYVLTHLDLLVYPEED